jgi:hypothetical protein
MSVRCAIALAALALVAAAPSPASAKYDLGVRIDPGSNVLSNDRDARGRGVLGGRVLVSNGPGAQTSPSVGLELGGDPIELELPGGICDLIGPASGLATNCLAAVPPLVGGRTRPQAFSAFYQARGLRSGTFEAEVGLPCTDADELRCANNSQSRTLRVVASPDSRIRAVSSRRFSGRSRGRSGGRRVRRVQIALLRLRRGTSAFKGLTEPLAAGRRRCLWLASRRGRFRRLPATGRSCNRPLWLRARGGRRWSFRLARPLRPGTYVVYSRAINRAGASEQSFTARDRNRRRFRVRQARR